MTSHINALTIRRVLNKGQRGQWQTPQPFGPDGWSLVNDDCTRSVIATCAPHDGREWIHASITGDGQVPTYDDLVLLHRAVFVGGWAYQVFAPHAEHVNIHEHALHLWGRLDGRPHLPNFARGAGSI